MKTPVEFMMLLAHLFHNMPAGRASLIGQRIGLDQGTINLLEQGQAAVRAHLASVRPDAVMGREVAQMEGPANGDFRAQSRSRSGRARNAGFGIAGEAVQWAGREAGVLPKKKQAAVRNEIMTDAVKDGLPVKVAAGLVGNMQAESGFNREPPQNAFNKEHYGLAQWDEARRALIEAHTGIDVAHASVKRQVAAAAWEFLHNQKAALTAASAAPNAGQAAISLDKHDQRSGDGAVASAAGRVNATAALAAYRQSVASLPPSVTNLVHHLRALPRSTSPIPATPIPGFRRCISTPKPPTPRASPSTSNTSAARWTWPCRPTAG
ncbi:MAG: phage tail tip lysozyme [Acidocella sp.]|nr:phage tail tip lysozyme [Acidocella sp.]